MQQGQTRVFTFSAFHLLAGLSAVTNVRSDGVNLRWNEPRNAPAGCITNYTITWNNGTFTTPDNTTSIPIDAIQGLEFCRNYTSITITPIVPPLGLIQSSSGELPNVALTPAGTEMMYSVINSCSFLYMQESKNIY